MAVATSTMLAIAGGVGVASSLYGGLSAKKQADTNAKIYAQQAEYAEKQGEIDAFRTKQNIKSYENSAIAQSALNSSSLSGSYLENLNETYTNAELDMGAVEFNTALTAQNYLTQSANSTASGQTAFTQGFIGAGSSLLSGYVGYNEYKSRGK